MGTSRCVHPLQRRGVQWKVWGLGFRVLGSKTEIEQKENDKDEKEPIRFRTEVEIGRSRASSSPTKPHPLSCSAVEGHHPFAEETRWCRWPAGLHGAPASRPRPPPNVSYLGGLGEGGPCRRRVGGHPGACFSAHPIQERAPDDPTPQPARKLHAR